MFSGEEDGYHDIHDIMHRNFAWPKTSIIGHLIISAPGTSNGSVGKSW
jgi:hypothetical protein